MSEPFRTPIVTGPWGLEAGLPRRLGTLRRGGRECERSLCKRCCVCYLLWQPERSGRSPWPPEAPLPASPSLPLPQPACWEG